MSEDGEILPTVSVLMIAYQHENYIAEAIEGVVSQQGSFNLRLIIGEDYGTDSTRIICEKYAQEHPNKIVLLPSDRNYGIQGNFLRVLKACLDADYIAICEGDDKWIDPNKLSKQLRFLLENNQYSAHAHNVIKKNIMTGETTPFSDEAQRELSFAELFNGWFFHAVSLFVRSDIFKDIPFDQLPYFISADRFMNRWIACHGRLFFDGKQLSAIYHRHDSGASQNSNRLALRTQERDMLAFFDNYVPKENGHYLVKAKMDTLQDLAYYYALGYGELKQKWALLLEYLDLMSFSNKQSYYFLCCFIFGRYFFRTWDSLKTVWSSKT